MKHEKIWYQFYYAPLEQFWLSEKGTKEKLYECIHILHTVEHHQGKALETVKKHLKTSNVQQWFLKSVIFLLNLTGFYQKFFDIGMQHRREGFNILNFWVTCQHCFLQHVFYPMTKHIKFDIDVYGFQGNAT